MEGLSRLPALHLGGLALIPVAILAVLVFKLVDSIRAVYGLSPAGQLAAVVKGHLTVAASLVAIGLLLAITSAGVSWVWRALAP